MRKIWKLRVKRVNRIVEQNIDIFTDVTNVTNRAHSSWVFNKRREINNLEAKLPPGKKKRSWFRLDHRGHSSSYINILPPWNHLQTLTLRDEDYKNDLRKITYRVGVREIYRYVFERRLLIAKLTNQSFPLLSSRYILILWWKKKTIYLFVIRYVII